MVRAVVADDLVVVNISGEHSLRIHVEAEAAVAKFRYLASISP